MHSPTKMPQPNQACLTRTMPRPKLSKLTRDASPQYQPYDIRHNDFFSLRTASLAYSHVAATHAQWSIRTISHHKHAPKCRTCLPRDARRSFPEPPHSSSTRLPYHTSTRGWFPKPPRRRTAVRACHKKTDLGPPYRDAAADGLSYMHCTSLVHAAADDPLYVHCTSLVHAAAEGPCYVPWTSLVHAAADDPLYVHCTCLVRAPAKAPLHVPCTCRCRGFLVRATMSNKDGRSRTTIFCAPLFARLHRYDTGLIAASRISPSCDAATCINRYRSHNGATDGHGSKRAHTRRSRVSASTRQPVPQCATRWPHVTQPDKWECNACSFSESRPGSQISSGGSHSCSSRPLLPCTEACEGACARTA